MFDLDESCHALQSLDAEGRKALVLAGKLREEIYRDEHRHVPASLIVNRYLTELSERGEEVRELRRRLDEALDGREAAESQLEKVRALATHWGLDTELNGALADRRPHCRREPLTSPPWDDERIDLLEAEVRRLHRESMAAREAEFVAIERMQQERLRAEAAEKKCGELRSELRALYFGKGRP